jgi:hypothetical protein
VLWRVCKEFYLTEQAVRTISDRETLLIECPGCGGFSTVADSGSGGWDWLKAVPAGGLLLLVLL